MNSTTSSLLLSSFLLAPLCPGAVLYIEEFDGNTNGYNPNSTTALVGDNDWVDFSDRINSDSLTIASGGSETVLAGTSNSNDPQVRADFDFSFTGGSIDGFQLRLRIDKDGANGFDDTLAGTDFGLFWGTGAYGHPGAGNVSGAGSTNLGDPTTLVNQGNGWHLATWQTPGGLSGNLVSMRIDPINNIQGVDFEIDYFTIGVPEPASASLLALGLAGLALRRRR